MDHVQVPRHDDEIGSDRQEFLGDTDLIVCRRQAAHRARVPHSDRRLSLGESEPVRADCPRAGAGVDSAGVGCWNLTRRFDQVPSEQVKAVVMAPDALQVAELP